MNWTGIGYSRDFGFYREYGFTSASEAIDFAIEFAGIIDFETKTVRI